MDLLNLASTFTVIDYYREVYSSIKWPVIANYTHTAFSFDRKSLDYQEPKANGLCPDELEISCVDEDRAISATITAKVDAEMKALDEAKGVDTSKSNITTGGGGGADAALNSVSDYWANVARNFDNLAIRQCKIAAYSKNATRSKFCFRKSQPQYIRNAAAEEIQCCFNSNNPQNMRVTLAPPTYDANCEPCPKIPFGVDGTAVWEYGRWSADVHEESWYTETNDGQSTDSPAGIAKSAPYVLE